MVIALLIIGALTGFVGCQNMPAPLIRNGGFELGRAFWTLNGSAVIAEIPSSPEGRRVLKCVKSGDSAVQTVIVVGGRRYTVRVQVKTEGVQAVNSGFAFAAVYEFNGTGQLVSFTDFVKATGTSNWKEATYHWQTQPGTFYVQVRCGLYNADGTVYFDGFRMNEGQEILEGRDEALGVGDRALIFAEPDLPQTGGAVGLQSLEEAFLRAGYKTKRIRARDLSDPDRLSDLQKDTSIIAFPNSVYFPLIAHKGLLQLLTSGVDLLCFGGYAFDLPMVAEGNGYRPWKESDLTVRQVLPNPGFEALDPAGQPIGWERSDSRSCFVTRTGAAEGFTAVGVAVAEEGGGAGWRTQIPVKPGETYRLSGWIKTVDVVGSGYAFVAYYPMAGERWIAPRDIAQVKGSGGWQKVSSTLVVPAGADSLSIRFGIYRAKGQAFFDDVRLEQVESPPYINTRYGTPADGLEVGPLQLGLFDADYPLRDVNRLESVAPFSGPWTVHSANGNGFSGYSAVGVLRRTARWIPLVAGKDRFGRLKGTAGALMIHHSGPFTGSVWAFFGVDSQDLTRLEGFTGQVLVPLLKRMRRAVYLISHEFTLACYRPGDQPTLRLRVANFGQQLETVSLSAELSQVPLNGRDRSGPVGRAERKVTVGAGGIEEVDMTFNAGELPEGLYKASVTVKVGQVTYDRGEAGFVVWAGTSFPQSLNFRYRDNYFWLKGRPTFLCGTDTWSNWFSSPSQRDPLFWWDQIVKCRDFGVRVLENLQYTPQEHQFSQEEWSQLDAALYLCHRAGVVYMAGLLIGHDVAVDDETLEKQERFVAQFARRYKGSDGLIYYLNGDYQLRPKNDQQRDLTWQLGQTEKWNRRLVASIKREDPDHPTTSEYYQVPIGGLDLRQTLDGLDLANIGYFDEPIKDKIRFPAVFKLIDHRLQGKSLNVGEFGVKTHPAWATELGGSGYHIKRTEEDRWQLFLLIPHYAFGLGGSKVQNWCWRDDDDRVFPWGLNYTCDGVEREALKAYRACALLLGRLQPVWRKPQTLLVVSDLSRRQAEGARSYRAALIGTDTLIRLRVDFAVVSDGHLTEETIAGVKAIFVPGALVLPDQAEKVLSDFTKRGGAVYRSGPGHSECWEWDVSEVGQQTMEQINRYRAVLDRAGVERIRVTPDLPVLHCFLIPLTNGRALIVVNGSDGNFYGQISAKGFPTVEMGLGPWEAGMIVEEAGAVTVAEGRGVITVAGQRIAESDGHYAIFSRDGQDIRDSGEPVFLPLRARRIVLERRRDLGIKILDAGEWRNGEWRVLERIPISLTNGRLVVEVGKELRGEVVAVKGWSPPL